MYEQEMARKTALSAQMQTGLGNSIPQAPEVRPGLPLALDEQDRYLSQGWQIINLLEERLRSVLHPQSLTAGATASAPTPIPERLLDRVQQNNGALNRQYEAIGMLIERLAL